MKGCTFDALSARRSDQDFRHRIALRVYGAIFCLLWQSNASSNPFALKRLLIELFKGYPTIYQNMARDRTQPSYSTTK